jgi:hypothetical protein
MIFPTDEEWNKWGITEEHHKFISLRWEEIFSEDTYDSWQVRTVNLKSILMEMVEAVSVAASYPKFHRNIKHQIYETRSIAQNDPIIQRHFPHIKDYIEKLEKCYDSEVKKGEKNSLSKFKRLVFVIFGQLNPYNDFVIKRLVDIISDPPQQNNNEIYKLVMALGVILKTEGYSISALRDSFNILIDSTTPNFIDRFENLISAFSSVEQEYECSFHVIVTREDINLEKYGIIFHDTLPDGDLSEVEKQFFGQDGDPSRISIRIKALDPYSARAIAEHSLENLFAAYNFYQPNRHPRFKHKFALVASETNDQFYLEKDDSRLEYIRDSKKPGKSISSLMNLAGQLPQETSDKLTASLQYHRLAMIANTDEARLVNLWIALESLIQEDSGSIIENICKYAPISIGLEYVLQTIKNLTISMRKIWRYSKKDELLKQLKYSDKYRLHQVDLLEVLLDDPESQKAKYFAAIVSPSLLLRYRFYSLRENMFRSPKTLSKKLKRHMKNIEWQLYRLYRSRNYIMHVGACPPRIRQLIQHLHSYYILIMHGLIHDLKTHNEWGIEHAFENRIMLNSMLFSRLKDFKSTPLSADELLYPSRMLVRKDDSPIQPAWEIKKDQK